MNPPADHSAPTMEQSGNVRIITFTADTVRDVENMLARELEGRTDGSGAFHLLLDFTHVEYLTSLELGTLIELHNRLKAGGGRLTLFNLNAQVYEVFTATHLHRVLEICREDTPLAVGGCTTAIKDKVERVKETVSGDSADPDKYLYSE